MLPAAWQPLANHLWQSTLFAGIAWLLTLVLRKNRAHVRYWVWLAASLKFLVPFSALLWFGAHFAIRTAAPAPPPAISAAFDAVSVPFDSSPMPAVVAGAPAPAGFAINWTLLASLVWLCGLLTLALVWWRKWRAVSTLLRGTTPVMVPLPIRAVVSTAVFEPGVFGIWRPVLLLPAGIERHMEPAQFEAVVAHEAAHVWRRDNLTSALHMLVEAIFWFHPLVWWMGARLTEERERACDEAVLCAGSQPRDYAAGILKVCELYLQSPLACVAGVSGANLRLRIEKILSPAPVRRLGRAGMSLLLSTAVGALVAPVLLGMVRPNAARASTFSVAQSQAAQPVTPRDFEAVSIKPSDPNQTVGRNRSVGSDPSFFKREQVSLVDLVLEAYDIPRYQGAHPQLRAPDWMGNAEFDIAARIPAGATPEQVRIMEQRMLAAQFGLVVHHEGEAALLPSITLAKGGLKLSADFKHSAEAPGEQQAEGLLHVGAEGFFEIPAGRTGLWMNRDPAEGVIHVSAKGESIEAIAQVLSSVLKTPVTDASGVTGTYDIRVSVPFAPGDNGGDPADWVRTFLQRVGLQLEQSKGNLDVLVVDHCERMPTPDTAIPPADPAVTAAVPSRIQSGAARPKFEVTSVKPCDPSAPGGRSGAGSPSSGDVGHMELTCQTLFHFIEVAYVEYPQGKRPAHLSFKELPLEGLPNWANSDRYEIAATSATPEDPLVMHGPMLQTLLEDRFQLTLHRETRNVPVYELHVAPGGLKMQRIAAGSCTPLPDPPPLPPARFDAYCDMVRGQRSEDGVLTISAPGITMRELVGYLDGFGLDRPLFDKTGLGETERFKLEMAFAPNEQTPGFVRQGNPNGTSAPASVAGPSLESALGQLGLRLESARGPSDFLVIDHVERPTGN